MLSALQSSPGPAPLRTGAYDLSQDDAYTSYERHAEEDHTDLGPSLCGFGDALSHLCLTNFLNFSVCFLFGSLDTNRAPKEFVASKQRSQNEMKEHHAQNYRSTLVFGDIRRKD